MNARLSLPVLALSCLAVAASPVAGAAADPSAVAAEARALAAAVSASDASALVESRGRLTALSAADPADATWHYWAAVATWRAVPLVQRQDKKRAKKLCEDGVRQAERLVSLDPRHAEGWALLAGLEGMSLSFSGPMAGMTLGPKMEEELKRAMTLDPENPRVHLMAGINTLHKPSFFGGGPDAALQILERAQALFAAESPGDSTAPAWGRDDAYLWAGQAQMKLERYAQAREAYLKALEANPENAWVRARLLPAADKALAAASSSER